jgi:hypothetical protein
MPGRSSNQQTLVPAKWPKLVFLILSKANDLLLQLFHHQSLQLHLPLKPLASLKRVHLQALQRLVPRGQPAMLT